MTENAIRSIRWRWLAVALAASTMLAACTTGNAGGGDEDADGGTTSVVVGLASFFVTDLTPGATQGSNVDTAVWTPLTQIEPGTGELLPGVATEWSSEDQKTWTFTLADDWTFHDGSAVTAQSFVDSFNVTATAANALGGNADMAIIEGYDEMNPTKGDPTATELSGVQPLDDKTLEITLTQANVFFPLLVAKPIFAPIPTGASEDLKAFGTNPIGNGPFKVRDGGWKVGDQDVFLEAYADYPGEKASVDEIDLRLYEDPAPIYTDFQSGAVDLALLDGDNLANARETIPEQLVDVEFPSMVALGFPVYDKAFADPDLRLAFSKAIDREAIVEALLKGNGTAASALLPDFVQGGGDTECGSCEYDPAEAKKLFDSAGGWDGPLTLYTYQEPTNERVIEAISNQLRDNLGIEKVTFKSLEIGQLYERFEAKSLDGPALVYAGSSFPNVYALADATLVPGRVLNVTGYKNTKVTDGLKAAASASSIDEGTSVAVDAVDTALEEVPFTPVFWPTGGIVHADNIEGVVPELLGGPSFVSIQVTK